MVGHDVCAALETRGETVLLLTKSDLDITDAHAVRDAVRRARPDVIVNCAAYTKVDDAEANEHLATAINGSAVEFLADAANDADALLVQLSTHFVFDGSMHAVRSQRFAVSAFRLRPLETDRRAGSYRCTEAHRPQNRLAIRHQRPELRRAIRNQVLEGCCCAS